MIIDLGGSEGGVIDGYFIETSFPGVAGAALPLADLKVIDGMGNGGVVGGGSYCVVYVEP